REREMRQTNHTAPPSLLELVAIERDCCARLHAILEAERTAAASYDLAALHACLRRREALQAEWQRVALLRARRATSERDEARTVRPRDAQQRERQAARRDIEALRREVTAVRRAQAINQALIRAAMGQVSDLLDIVRRELPDSRYDGRACLTAPL